MGFAETITDKVGRHAHFSFETRPARKWDYVFPVTINYDQPFEEMVEAGAYDYRDTDVNETNFPIIGVGVLKREMHLLTVGKGKIEDVLLRMARKGLRPANIAELLAFGAQYPEQQCKGSILATGSIWKKREEGAFADVLQYTNGTRYTRDVPRLTRNDWRKTRFLTTGGYTPWMRLDGNPYWGFLAVPIREQEL